MASLLNNCCKRGFLIGLEVGIDGCCCEELNVGPEGEDVPALNSSGTNLLFEELDVGIIEGEGETAKVTDGEVGEGDAAGDLKRPGTNLFVSTGFAVSLK